MEKAITERIGVLRTHRVVERIWAGDHTVWSPDPTEVADRLGWLRIHQRSLSEAPDIARFARLAASEEFESVVLLGMGGSSLAPEVFASALAGEGLELHVLDSTDPRQIAALERRSSPARTLFVVSSKSGGTIETRSQMEYFWSKAPDGHHFVAITDPGTELDRIGVGRGFRRVFLNDPEIGGRYSALSYFGIVPAALRGIDTETILAPAARMAEACGADVPVPENPGVRLGVFMGEAALAGRDKLTLVLPPEVESLGHWIEQLVAESTGKHARGILPIEAETLGPPEVYGDDRAFV
ncbi:MAG TPA: hypothetical protein PKD27_09875, partial [Tepidiformaceae bacterium]|nr:hypothetical protein [Tepidiformaceae bacterium]